jgi:hypothetical protein
MDTQELHHDRELQLGYLRLSPWEAFIAMVNDQYHYGLFPETTTLVDRESLDNGRLEITIAVQRSKRLSNLLPPFEQATFVLNRLHLGEYFNSPVQFFRSQLPEVGFRRSDLLDVIFATEGNSVYRDISDIEDEWVIRDEVSALTQHVIEAHPLSLRWVGSVRADVVGFGGSRVPFTVVM